MPEQAPAQTTGVAAQGDPSGVARPVEAGRLERSANNSGVIVGESKTTTTTQPSATHAGTSEDAYKTEFVKVYQDAGVVGMSMLTLLVLCLLLGLFCSRLIKMYIALTASRDTLEAARTAAIEKLTTSLVLLRSETNTVVAELRREHDHHSERLTTLTNSTERYAEKAQRSYEMLERLYEAARTSTSLARSRMNRPGYVDELPPPGLTPEPRD